MNPNQNINVVDCDGKRNENEWGRDVYDSVSQQPGRGPVPGPGSSYTGPREVLLENVILVF